MKQLFATIFITCSCAATFSQSIDSKEFDGYPDVERYYKGSLAIAKGLNAPEDERNYYFEDAIELLYQDPDDQESKFYKPLDATVRRGSDVAVGTDSISFDYKFARSQYAGRNIRENGSLREDATDSGLCRVKNLAVKPNGSIVIEDIQKGKSIVAIVTNVPNSLSLEVEGSETLKGKSFEGGLVEYCNWEENGENDVVYTISNKTNGVVPFVVICN